MTAPTQGDVDAVFSIAQGQGSLSKINAAGLYTLLSALVSGGGGGPATAPFVIGSGYTPSGVTTSLVLASDDVNPLYALKAFANNDTNGGYGVESESRTYRGTIDTPTALDPGDYLESHYIYGFNGIGYDNPAASAVYIDSIGTSIAARWFFNWNSVSNAIAAHAVYFASPQQVPNIILSNAFAGTGIGLANPADATLSLRATESDIDSTGTIFEAGRIISSSMVTADPHVAGELYSVAGVVHISAG